MALLSRSAPFGLVFLFLLLITYADSVSAQQFPRENNRQSADRVRPIQTTPIDISGAGGSFYFIDQLGLSGLGVGDSIDPDTYLLGPGDLVSITLSGNVNGSFRGMMVNPQGMVIIPNVGSVEVGGISVTEAAEKVAELVDDFFQETRSQLTLERPKNIKVHLAGDIPNPGSYMMPASTRLDQAVQVAFSDAETEVSDAEMPLNPVQARTTRRTELEQPNLSRRFILDGKYGFRNIRIKRENGTEIKGDLVSYVVGGEMSGNPQVQHGDIVYIYEKKAYAPQISVSGSVMSPITMEYSEGDSVDQLIELSGGFSFDADQEDIQVYRYTLDGIQQIDVDDPGTFELQANDRIVVGFNRDLRASFSAEVSGEAVSPGVFPIQNGVTTARELLEYANGTTDLAQVNAARLTRQRGDYEQLRFGRETYAYDRLRIRRTSDQLIEGFEYLDLEDSLGQNHVFIDLTDPEQLENVRIYDNDKLHIPQSERSIFVFGQVLNSGYYTYDPDMDANEYIEAAGGFAIAAESQRVFVIKAGSNAWVKPYETNIESGDLVFVDRQPYETLEGQRRYQFERRELRNRNVQLILTGIGTITGIITTYVAVRRL
jgi:protein involved in polysaccharide export with SLBB domain